MVKYTKRKRKIWKKKNVDVATKQNEKKDEKYEDEKKVDPLTRINEFEMNQAQSLADSTNIIRHFTNLFDRVERDSSEMYGLMSTYVGFIKDNGLCKKDHEYLLRCL